MTVASTVTKVSYTGNGAATEFSFTFRVFAAADLQVIVTEITTGAETVLASGYTVALNADQQASPGGSVTYPSSGTPLAATHRITIRRLLTLTQSTDIKNQGGYYPRSHEDVFDRLTMQDQQQQEQLDRAIKAPASDTALNLVMPAAALRAGGVLGFDAYGALRVYSPLSATSLASNVACDGGTHGLSVQAWLDGAERHLDQYMPVVVVDVAKAINDFMADTAKPYTLRLPAGRLTCKTAINVSRPCRIVGAGMDIVGDPVEAKGTVLLCTPEVQNLISSDNVVIEDLTLDGQRGIVDAYAWTTTAGQTVIDQPVNTYSAADGVERSLRWEGKRNIGLWKNGVYVPHVDWSVAPAVNTAGDPFTITLSTPAAAGDVYSIRLRSHTSLGRGLWANAYWRSLRNVHLHRVACVNWLNMGFLWSSRFRHYDGHGSVMLDTYSADNGYAGIEIAYWRGLTVRHRSVHDHVAVNMESQSIETDKGQSVLDALYEDITIKVDVEDARYIAIDTRGAVDPFWCRVVIEANVDGVTGGDLDSGTGWEPSTSMSRFEGSGIVLRSGFKNGMIECRRPVVRYAVNNGIVAQGAIVRDAVCEWNGAADLTYAASGKTQLGNGLVAQSQAMIDGAICRWNGSIGVVIGGDGSCATAENRAVLRRIQADCNGTVTGGYSYGVFPNSYSYFTGDFSCRNYNETFGPDETGANWTVNGAQTEGFYVPLHIYVEELLVKTSGNLTRGVRETGTVNYTRLTQFEGTESISRNGLNVATLERVMATNGVYPAGATTHGGIRSGNGSPEGNIYAAPGSLWMRTDGASGTLVYLKQAGTGNTGWVAKW